MDAEALYRNLQHLVASMPDLRATDTLQESPQAQQWLGRAGALVERASGLTGDEVTFRMEVARLGYARWDPSAIQAIIYRALARAELMAPASVQGAFVPVGAAFDSFAVLSKVLSTATQGVLIVDPYLDSVVLTDFASLVPQGVPLMLLTDGKSAKLSADLEPAVRRWLAQHGTARPLEARKSAPGALHDRLLFIDGSAVWALSQSLKDFAKRSPASIAQLDPAIAQLKFDAYAAIWTNSTPL